ncbi:MAG: hypothetical protein Q7J29_13055 [Stagnimonas sp.]|nr:hypothetical protein [Stagnimonas sp.]
MRARKKGFFESDHFAKVLAEDVALAKQRMDNCPTEAHRRDFVRATHAAIEAQSWQLRMYLIEHVLDRKAAPHYEISALKEETYVINDKGEIYVQPKGYSLKVSLRLVLSILKRHGIPMHVDFCSAEWGNIDHAVKIRNRITHPKSMKDIEVSKEDAERCYHAYAYVHAMLLNAIFGSAIAALNAGPTAKKRSSFFSSAT